MTKMLRLSTAILLVCLLQGLSSSAALAATGRIEGHVTGPDGGPVSGVLVKIEGALAANVTDPSGYFEFRGVRAGSYSIVFRMKGYEPVRSAVVVTAGSTTTADQVVDWDVGLVEMVTTEAASRRRERIVDAPAAVTTVTEDEIARQASHGQLPKLFEFTPGVDITQISAVEFLVSTRGFNSNLNRRTAVLLDGRDLTDPFVGAMEWTTVVAPLDDLAEAELVRGPTSALYGANATGGVVSMTSRDPRENPGGLLRLTSGERGTTNADFRWAGELANDWYLKAVGGKRISDGFAVSRFDSVEYGVACDTMAVPPVVNDCVPLDAAAFPRLPEDEIDVSEGSLRLDKYLADGRAFTFEGGTTEYEGPTFLNGQSRGQIRSVEKPWARFNFGADHWNVSAYYNKRKAEAVNLYNAAQFHLDAHNYAVEFQTHWNLADDRLRLVGGASYFDEKVESNVQSAPADTDQEALFAQADWSANERLKLVGALRWDRSSLFDDRVSPKGSIVFSATPLHTLRLSYNEGFQLPTYAEFFLYYVLVPDVDLSALEQICIDAGYACGLDQGVPFGILGNPDLKLEETITWEVGYKGVLAKQALLTLDLFASQNQNFVSPLLTQLTPDGRTNRSFHLWEVPPDIWQDFWDAASGLLPPGSELVDYRGTPFILQYSQKTLGRVDTRGADLGLDYHVGDGWRISATYSWLDFDIKSDLDPGVAHVVQPNAPEHKASAGLSYVADRWNASVRGRWVDEFRWVNSSDYYGTVESFTTVDLFGGYALNDSWEVGAYVSNLFDDEHWEAWGADLLGRRALAHLTFSW